MIRLATTAVFAVLAMLGAESSSARTVSLDKWFDRELIPSVIHHLDTHPRFRNETLLFVVLGNDRPAPITNALAMSLRDRLLAAAVEANGIRVAWQQAPHGQSSCTRDKPGYYVGIDIAPGLDGRYRVSVRALDVVEGRWIGGFPESWEGSLSSREHAAYRNPVADTAFLGTREVPYSADQFDLVAQHLSHALACEIFSALDADYVVTLDAIAREASTAQAEPLAGTIELAARNLDEGNAIELTADREAANARLDGKAHSISGNLHQYWLGITPLSGNAGSLSTSVYVMLDDANELVPDFATSSPSIAPEFAPEVAPAHIAGVLMPGNSKGELVAPLSVFRAGRNNPCVSGTQGCAILQTLALNDVIVFTLVHAGELGLSRLANETCQARPSARVLANGHTALFPVAGPPGLGRDTSASGRWLTEPGTTVYYAVATDNAPDARRIAALIERLPVSCRGRATNGLKGYELQQWLEALSRLLLEVGPHASWRALSMQMDQGA